ncbi:TPA: hypothetical protein DCX15_04230 [bacterium]|nr:hypothetical protein [bacterium]
MQNWFSIDEGLDETLLSFDEYQRLKMVSDLINNFKKSGLKILDVGGGVGNLEHFAPEHRVVVADKMTTGIDGTDLPYPDRDFDVSVSIDTLEHIPSKERKRFIEELIRVAKDRIYLAIPTKEAEEVERFIYELTKDPYLEEHIRHGLPDTKEVESYLQDRGLEYHTYKNGYLGSWFGMLLLRHFGPKDTLPFINRFFNRSFYEYDHSYPVYRIVFEIIK